MKKVIAWIEDDIDALAPVMEPLIERGFSFKKFRTYQQALDNVATLRSCDLIILDLILPPGKSAETDEDDYLGAKLLRRLRDELRVKTPILIFSVVAHASDVLPDSELKKYDVRAEFKPIRQERLMRAVHELIGIPFEPD
jgi:CheY-like chemotaxis protein